MYNYNEEIFNDVKEAILDNYTEKDIRENLKNRCEWEEKLWDDLWTNDNVTGNASGSYTFSRWQAEDNLAHNGDLIAEALAEFGYSGVDLLGKGAEWLDVLIRCYLLPQGVTQVLDELEEEYFEEDEESEDAEAIDD